MVSNNERMATMESDIKYIRESLTINTKQHSEMIKALNNFKLEVENELKTKADKVFVDELSTKIWVFTGSLIGVLLTVTGVLLSFILLH